MGAFEHHEELADPWKVGYVLGPSSCNYIPDDNSSVMITRTATIAAAGNCLDVDEFQRYRIVKIDEEESYAANCVWVNGRVLLAKGYPRAAKTISEAGYRIIELDVSEFRKLDGGLSCLSLRF